jgi:heme a synthase
MMPWFYRLTLAATVLCLVVVVLGAYVRLSDAGLGCPDWPGCYGHLTIPKTEADIARAEAQYPERPVEARKAWLEMIHRYVASLLGFVLIITALLSLRHRNTRLPTVLPWVLLVAVLIQGTLGMWTVTWLLKPAVVTAHLMGGMTILSLLFLQTLATRRALRPDAPSSVPPPHVTAGMRRLGLIALLVLAMQIFLGGWTSTNYAALGCPDFPTCHGAYWPPQTDFGSAFTFWHGIGEDYEGGRLASDARATIHYVHRLGAIVATLVIGLFAWQLWRRARCPGTALAMTVALALQVLIGISVVKLQLPLWLATAHNFGAAVLLLSVVGANHRLWRAG